VRLVPLLVCLPTLLPAQDPREIVRRATEVDRHNIEIARNYTFLQHQEKRETDSFGKVKSLESETWDVTLQEGSPYRRLKARNDQPLSAKEEKKEEEKLRTSIEQRRKETKEQRDLRIAEWERRQQQRREPIKELPDAFNFTLVKEEALNGGQAYVIDATPKPGYRPRLASASYFPKIKARLWIDKTDYQWIKAEIESLDTVSFGGIVLRMAKGSRLLLEQERVNNEVWLPKAVSFQGAFRILLVKGYRGQYNITFRDYRKFQADSRVISVQ
jgi:hypothetical protein